MMRDQAWNKWTVLPILLCAWTLARAEPESNQLASAPDGAKQTIDPLPIDAEVTGITRPHRTATLTAMQTARVVKTEGTEGAFVEQGSLLVLLDDGVQRVLTDKARADAESLLAVELARVDMEHAETELERIRRLSGDDDASRKEFQDAEVAMQTSRLAHAEAELAHEQAQREYEFQRLLLERLHIRAPFSGYVTEIFKEQGETALEADDILTLVELNPLEVSVDCPLELAGRVKVDDRVPVEPVDARWEPRMGAVVFVSPVVDPASRTFKVKLLVDNSDDGWVAGFRVSVDFASATTTPDTQTPATVHASKDRPTG